MLAPLASTELRLRGERSITSVMRRWILAIAVCLAVLAARGPLQEFLGDRRCHAGLAEAAEQTVFFTTKSLIYHHD